MSSLPAPIDPATDRSLSVAERRWLLVVFALLGAATCVPFWVVAHHPMPDLAVHLAAGAVMHHHDDPAWDFARYYDLQLGLTPYWAHYGLLHLLAYPFGIEGANRILLSLYALLLPSGTALLAHRFGRSPWLALFAFPLVWNFNFRIGFFSFCIGLAALPFALVAFDRFCERPSRGRTVVAALAGVGMFFCHLLPWVTWVGAAGLVGLCHRGRSWRRIAGRAAVWGLAVGVGVLVTLRGSGLNMGRVGGRLAFSRVSLTQAAREIYQWVWGGCVAGVDEILAAVLLVAWALLFLTARRARPTLHDLRAPACFVVGLGCYLLMPRSVLAPAYWWGLNVRFACIALLFFALCVPGGAIVGWRRFLLAPVAAAGLGFAVDITVHWRRADEFAAGFGELAPQVGRGNRVLFVLGHPWHDPTVRLSATTPLNYVHIYYDLYQARHGGYMPWNFDEGFPLRYKVRYPAPGWRPMDFSWERHARYYDHVLAFQRSAPELFGAHASEVKEVARSGRWILFRLPGPRVDAPPAPPYPSGWAHDPTWRPPPPPLRPGRAGGASPAATP